MPCPERLVLKQADMSGISVVDLGSGDKQAQCGLVHGAALANCRAMDLVVTMLCCAYLRRRCKERLFAPEPMGEIIYVVRTSLLWPYVVHTSPRPS
jgi:hypothetical protein